MGFPRRDRRGDSKTVGLFKMLGDPPPKPAPVPFPAILIKLPRMRYRALPDMFTLGDWRVEPVEYTGRGVVYFFRTRTDAEAKAAEVNIRQGFK